jgi:hypothetical protein
MSLLSPSGGFLMGPLKTPRLARLSTILSADMEPQMPQEPAPTDAPAGNTGLAGLFGPNMAHAGTKRTHSEAKFDDECTEICEAAQGEQHVLATLILQASRGPHMETWPHNTFLSLAVPAASFSKGPAFKTVWHTQHLRRH